MQNPPTTLDRSAAPLLYLPVVAGILLLLLLPIGETLGPLSALYKLVMFVHLGVLLAAIAVMLYFVAQLGSMLGANRHWFIVPSLIFVGLILLEASHPISARDALTHHLAVPKWWLEQNQVAPIAWHEWSYYPMLIQLAYAGLLSRHLEALTPYYHLLYLLLFAGDVAFFTFGKTSQTHLKVSKSQRPQGYVRVRHNLDKPSAWLYPFKCVWPRCPSGGRNLLPVYSPPSFCSTNGQEVSKAAEAALLGCMLALLLPACIGLAAAPLVDLGLAFFTLHAIVCGQRYADKPHNSRLLYLCGISLGLAMGTKYNGMLAAALVLLLLFVFFLRHEIGFKRTVMAVGIVGGFALLYYLPWMLQNRLLTGNPFYPLYGAIFGSATVVQSGPPGLSPIGYRMLMYGENWIDLVTTPLRMLCLGQDGNPRNFDGVLSPLLLFGLIPVFRRRKDPWVVFLALFIAAYYSGAILSTSWRIRYLAPIFGPLVILAAVGMAHMRGASQLIYRAFILLQVGLSLLYITQALNRSGAVTQLLDRHPQSQYLSEHLVEYPLANYVNTTLPQGAGIYLLYTSNQFYYYDRKVFSGGYNSERALVVWLKQAHSAGEILQQFKNRGLTHIIVNRRRAFDGLASILNEQEKLRWNEFLQAFVHEISQRGDYAVWELGTSQTHLKFGKSNGI